MVMILDSWINKNWPNCKGKWKYNYELKNYGFPHISEIIAWVRENPKERCWGNMGYISCNKEEDAMMVVLRWG